MKKVIIVNEDDERSGLRLRSERRSEEEEGKKPADLK
jgi:hypothetical protein